MLLCLLFCNQNLLAQDYSGRMKSSKIKLLALPFFDDFIQNKKYPLTNFTPDTNRWINSGAFINMSYPINAPSYGCATLDGLSFSGLPYSTILNAWGGADTLTSQFIDLSKSKIGDSIFFSFFFQPKGLGDFPDVNGLEDDSLILEFKNKNDNWVEAWGHGGYATDPNVDSFKAVLVAVADSMYLDSFFQFNFFTFFMFCV